MESLRSNFYRCLCACGWLLVAGSLPLSAQLSPAYEEPDLTVPVFDVNRLSLDESVRSRLAAVLAAGVTDFNATLDAKILGIALRLDPANRSALDTAKRRKRGELPDKLTSSNPTYTTATVVAYLVGQSAGLRAKGGADNLVLAGYLNAIAADIDPDNPVARYEKAAFAGKNPEPNWAFLKTKPAAEPESLPLLKRQSKIQGLGVSELPNGERTGAVMEMIITAEEVHSRQEMGITVAQPLGQSMAIALQEAGRAVKLRHPSFGYGQHLVLSFGDKYTNKDGPSGATAFTLLLYSLYDPLRLAADCAITGDMTVDGRIRAVGAVPSKIHAALLDGCRIVAIPKENETAVADVPFLYPANTLWKLQIFTVDTLDDALAVMREDRPVDLQKAIDLFIAVQRKVGLETPRLSVANSDLVPQLKEILRLAPGHASAAAMLRTLEGKAPNTLSLYASLDEVQRITHATLEAAKATKERPTLDQRALGEGVNHLEELRLQLDYRVTELCAANLGALRSLQNVNQSKSADERAAEYHKRVEAIEEVEYRMRSNVALIEALKH